MTTWHTILNTVGVVSYVIASLAIGLNVVGEVSYLFAALVIVAGAAAIIRSQAIKTSVDLLREENRDLRSLMEAQKERLVSAEKEITALKETNRILTETVTNAAAVAALSKTIVDNHKAVMNKLGDLFDK